MELKSFYCDTCNEELLHIENMIQVSGVAIITYKGVKKKLKTCHFCSPECLIKYLDKLPPMERKHACKY